MTVVAAGILQQENRVLICQRRVDQPHPLKWEFPGGKVEPGETPQGAIVRELHEELGIHCGEVREITRYEFAYPGKPPILLIFLRVLSYEGEIRNLIFNDIAWEPPDRLVGYDFLEGDLPFLSMTPVLL